MDFYSLPKLKERLFDQNIELLPSVTEYFELELAYLEYYSLDNSLQHDRLAYFKSVNGVNTKHYDMLNELEKDILKDRSSTTINYFRSGLFATGYCTHSLFPYRGKFHPQLIKAVLNIIGVKNQDIVFDPMCGSGTTNIEAALNGIDSIALDLSPFCRFMTKVKHQSMTIKYDILFQLKDKSSKVFDYFENNQSDILEKIKRMNDPEKSKVYELALLAFLDAMGYSKRVKTSSHRQLFDKVINRYIAAISDYLKNKSQYINKLGDLKIIDASALSINLEDESIDAVITSPPYSFAIDYIENDRVQLEFFGNNLEILKNQMIGLKGNTKKDKIENYFSDMDNVCYEISRVLKNLKYLVVIIGSNTNQTGGVRLEQNLIDSCQKYGLNLKKSILKPIKGMRNTMKEEFILFFRKEI